MARHYDRAFISKTIAGTDAGAALQGATQREPETNV